MPEKKAAKTAAKKTTRKGDGYSCEVCGLSIVVDEDCDCVEACDIICCGEPMKEKKVNVKAKAKVAAKA